MSRFYDDTLAPTGLSINQYSILARLDRLGASTVQDLARALVMDRSTLGHLIRPLEARGFVSLAVGTADKRCRMMSLTQGGRAILVEARPLWAAAQARFEMEFGATKAATLRATLASIPALPFESDLTESDRP